jgi:hypothetical protein
MTDLPGSVRAAVWSEITGIAAAPGRVGERAQALLEPLRRVLPCAAAWIAVRDPVTRRHVSVGTAGDTGPLASYFAQPDADDELERLGLNRRRPPMRASDLPVPLAETRAWGEYLLPAGFRDGIAVGLFSADGRHLGFLSLLTDDPADSTAAHAGLVAALRPLLALAIDRLPSLGAVARLTGDAVAGAVLTHDGRPLPLPGLADHPQLAPGSPVLSVARAYLTAPGAHASFLAPAPAPEPAPDPAGALVRITVLDCRDDTPDHLAAVVLVRDADLAGVRSEDLNVLGALLDGWPDERIAARFPGVAVAERVDRVAERLALSSRPRVLLHAAREGLFVPPPLWPVQP